jgi:transcriptional regulator with XRE-family HTH domain
METIGGRIRTLRKERGLTQPELATAIGKDQSTISDIERGAGFSAETLMALCDALETTAEYVMRGKNQVPSPNLKRAQAAMRTLTDEERLDLLTAMMQPGLIDTEVEHRIPATKQKLVTIKDDTKKNPTGVQDSKIADLVSTGAAKKPKSRRA